MGDHGAERDPGIVISIELDEIAPFLTQDIEPVPAIELLQNGDRTEFTVANQENRGAWGDQTAHIGQQSQLFVARAMSFDMLDPSPGNGNRTFAVGHADDQQLMLGTNLGAIRVRDWAANHCLAIGAYQSRTRMAVFAKKRSRRRTVLKSLALPGILPAIRLKVTERLW